MIETYKILNGFYDPNVVPKLQVRQGSNLRGHSKTLRKIRFNISLRGHSFTQRIVNVWNNLPESVISASSVNSFKNRLDKCWQDEDIKYNYKASLSNGRQKASFNELQLDTEVGDNLNPDTS